MSHVRAWVRFALLAITVLGGLLGIVITLRALFSPDSQGFGTFFVIGVFLVAYIYVTVAGVIFWRRPNQTKSLKWALAIQIPWISLPGLVYKFAAGLYLSGALIAKHQADKYSAGLDWTFQLGPSFEFRLLQDAPIQLGVNVVALAALLLLTRSITPTSATLTQPMPEDDPLIR